MQAASQRHDGCWKMAGTGAKPTDCKMPLRIAGDCDGRVSQTRRVRLSGRVTACRHFRNIPLRRSSPYVASRGSQVSSARSTIRRQAGCDRVAASGGIASRRTARHARSCKCSRHPELRQENRGLLASGSSTRTFGLCSRTANARRLGRYTVRVRCRKGAAASAAGDWMVGPPSSWSLRDQEDASARLVHRVDTLFDVEGRSSTFHSTTQFRRRSRSRCG